MKFSSQFITALCRFGQYSRLLLNKPMRVFWYFIIICALCFCIKCGAFFHGYAQAGGISGLANTYLPEFSIENGKLICSDYKFEDEIAGIDIVVDTSPDFVATKDMVSDNTVAVIEDSTKLIVANPMQYQEIRFDDRSFDGLTKEKIVKYLEQSLLVKLMLGCIVFMMFGMYVFNYAIYVLLSICIGNLINAFVKTQIRYGGMVKLGIYAITFPSLLTAVTSAVMNLLGYTGNNNFNVILFAVLVGVYMYLGLKNIKASNGYIVATL